MHRAPTTSMLRQVDHAANCKKWWYSLAYMTNPIDINCHWSWKPKVPQDESHIWDQSCHNNQPLYQRLALVGKKSSSDIKFPVQLMSERAEDLWHKPCPTTDMRCLVMQKQMLNMTPNTTTMLLGHWMHLNANATWKSQWPWFSQ